MTKQNLGWRNDVITVSWILHVILDVILDGIHYSISPDLVIFVPDVITKKSLKNTSQLATGLSGRSATLPSSQKSEEKDTVVDWCSMADIPVIGQATEEANGELSSHFFLGGMYNICELQ